MHTMQKMPASFTPSPGRGPGKPCGCGEGRWRRSFFGSPFCADESGAIVVLFALVLPVIIVLLGGALDYSRALEARIRLQTAAQSTLSNLSSHIRSGMVRNRHQLRSMFIRHLRAEYMNRLREKGLDLETAYIILRREKMGLRVNVRVKARMHAPFLGIIGNKWIDVRATASMRINADTNAYVRERRCEWLLRRYRRAHDLQQFLELMRQKGVDPERLRKYEDLYDLCHSHG